MRAYRNLVLSELDRFLVHVTVRGSIETLVCSKLSSVVPIRAVAVVEGVLVSGLLNMERDADDFVRLNKRRVHSVCFFCTWVSVPVCVSECM